MDIHINGFLVNSATWHFFAIFGAHFLFFAATARRDISPQGPVTTWSPISQKTFHYLLHNLTIWLESTSLPYVTGFLRPLLLQYTILGKNAKFKGVTQRISSANCAKDISIREKLIFVFKHPVILCEERPEIGRSERPCWPCLWLMHREKVSAPLLQKRFQKMTFRFGARDKGLNEQKTRCTMQFGNKQVNQERQSRQMQLKKYTNTCWGPECIPEIHPQYSPLGAKFNLHWRRANNFLHFD